MEHVGGGRKEETRRGSQFRLRDKSYRSVRMRIEGKIGTSSRGHVINGNSASSTLVPCKQPNGSKTIVAGATMEDNNCDLASDGRYFTFVVLSIISEG